MPVSLLRLTRAVQLIPLQAPRGASLGDYQFEMAPLAVFDVLVLLHGTLPL